MCSKFTEKHLRWTFFFNKVARLRPHNQLANNLATLLC